MITAIVFDIGMVLANENRRQQYKDLAKEYGYNIDDFSVARKKYVGLCARGKLTGQEYIFSIAKELGIQDKEKYYERWIYYCRKHSAVNNEVKEIIQTLKGKYILATLSNIIPPHHIVRKELNIDEYFDVQLLSFEKGYKKPDIEFYELVLKELHLLPEEIVFIDDHQPYVDVAKKLGMHTILFQNASQLREELRALKIKI